MAEKVTGRELARRLGVSEAAIRKGRARGLYRTGRDGLFDLDEATAAHETGRDPDAALKGALGGAAVSKQDDAAGVSKIPEGSLTRARTAHAVLKIQREQLELQKAKGALISKADALRACIAVATVVNERIDGAAAQIGPRVVGLTAAEAERVAREVLSSIRAEIAGMGAAIETISTPA